MANTDFSVLLKAELDRAGIDTDLKKVQEIVKKYAGKSIDEEELTQKCKNMTIQEMEKVFGVNCNMHQSCYLYDRLYGSFF